MTPATLPQTGELYLVKFHSATGAELKKYRPALVISVIHPEIKENLVLICPLSTVLSPSAKLEVTVNNPALNQPAAVLCWYIRTVDATRLVKKLGTFSLSDLKKVQNKVTELLNL